MTASLFDSFIALFGSLLLQGHWPGNTTWPAARTKTVLDIAVVVLIRTRKSGRNRESKKVYAEFEGTIIPGF